MPELEAASNGSEKEDAAAAERSKDDELQRAHQLRVPQILIEAGELPGQEQPLVDERFEVVGFQGQRGIHGAETATSSLWASVTPW